MNGNIMVKVAKLGAAVQEVMLAPGSTVADALRAAGVDGAGFEVRLAGNPCDNTARVEGGSIITLVPPIKGGK